MESLRLLIGSAFAAVLVLFLFIAFFASKHISHGQWAILRFLCALCAGAAGAFLTGEAVFRLGSQTTSGQSLVVAGTAGIALFFAVWYGFGKFVETPPDSYAIAIGKGWTFKQAANAIAADERAVVEFVGFEDKEMQARLEERQLEVKTPLEALQTLRALSLRQPIRPYKVSFSRPTYTLKIS